MREWGFWTEHKLDLLTRYLDRFTLASKNKATATVYLDLFAGQVENISRATGQLIDGSPVRALRAHPEFTVVSLFEMPARATELRQALTRDFPGRDIRVYPGDCNVSIDAALADLAEYAWAPTFAFIDQQSTELRWETVVKLAGHKKRSPYKVELWILFAHAQLPRALGINRETDEKFALAVDDMLGTTEWRAAYKARRDDEIDGKQFRYELTNWLRWRLEKHLGYHHTHAFELLNEKGGPVYSMVFATDNKAGNDIMSYLYGQAAEEHPKMREQALARAQGVREEKTGELGLFPPLPRESTVAPLKLYKPAPPARPYGYQGQMEPG